MSENWKPIPTYPGYEASDLGRVRSVDRCIERRGGIARLKGRMLKPSCQNSGYLFVSLGKGNPQLVHRAVAQAWIGEPGELDVNHIDGNKHNNAASNLEFCTRRENMQHAKRIGIWINSGERNGQAKATDQQVRDAYALVAKGATDKAAAAAVGITVAAVHSAVNGSKWKHLGLLPLNRRGGIRKLTPAQRANILALAAEGLSIKDIAPLLSVGKTSVWRVLHSG